MNVYVCHSCSGPTKGWFDHVTSFWKYREDHDNLLYLKYEDMHKVLMKTV